jgi:phage terminase Nu1 subunit (DNA packaging protein)
VKVTPLLDQVTSQADFAEMVGVSEARVSQLMADGVMPRGGTAHDWLLAYCDRLRDQAAGRAGTETGGLDLVQERAALAREQRISQELKNQVSRGEFAPIGVLADVLGHASSAVADRFDQIEGALRTAAPDITEDVLMTVLSVVSSARNEWMRSTARLVSEAMDVAVQDDANDDADDGSEDWLRTGLAAFSPGDDSRIFEAPPV